MKPNLRICRISENLVVLTNQFKSIPRICVTDGLGMTGANPPVPTLGVLRPSIVLRSRPSCPASPSALRGEWDPIQTQARHQTTNNTSFCSVGGLLFSIMVLFAQSYDSLAVQKICVVANSKARRSAGNFAQDSETRKCVECSCRGLTSEGAVGSAESVDCQRIAWCRPRCTSDDRLRVRITVRRRTRVRVR